MQAGERLNDSSVRRRSRAGIKSANCWSVDAATLSLYADTPLRLFDPFKPDVADEFADFLATDPMSNQRPLPARAIRDTCSALRMSLAHTPGCQPTYFVATNLEKMALAPLSAHRRARLEARYGEALYPQSIGPVFASHADADVPAMLHAATGLDAGYFARAPGNRDRLHALFLLTEASHCGFLARCSTHADSLRPMNSVADLRAVFEAVGDFEAVSAFRIMNRDKTGCDEADVLEASRVLAMFLSETVSAYTTIPAMSIAFEECGIVGGIRKLPEMTNEVIRVRQRVRSMVRTLRCGRVCRDPIEYLDLVRKAAGLVLADWSPGGTNDSAVARTLLSQFDAAVSVIRNAGSERDSGSSGRPRARMLLTLPGAAAA